MKIGFDRAKSAANARDRGLSFERAADFEWADAVIIEDVRNLYPEPASWPWVISTTGYMCCALRHGKAAFESSAFVGPTNERCANMAKRLPLTDEEGEVRELTQADFSRGHPASRVLSEILGEDLAGQMLRGRSGQRGPQRAPLKRQVTLRLDPEVLDFFKATGAGWQTRINEALRRAMRRSGRQVRS